jgi:hypothetical protein
MNASAHSIVINLLISIRVARWHAYFQTKNPNLGKFWRVLQFKIQNFGTFYGHCSILIPFGIFCDHTVYFMVIRNIFPVLVCCTKKNLATLMRMPCPLKRSVEQN